MLPIQRILTTAGIAVLAAVALAARPGTAAQRVPGTTVEILTPTGGVDFRKFVLAACKSVQMNWYAYMPDEAQLGRKGKVVARFAIRRDGQLTDGSPQLEAGSGNQDLDRAALSAIKRAAPFKRFPQQFDGPSIELRFFFYYNLPPELPN